MLVSGRTRLVALLPGGVERGPPAVQGTLSHGALVDVLRLSEGPGGGERPALYVGDWRGPGVSVSVLGHPQLVQAQLGPASHPGRLGEGVDVTAQNIGFHQEVLGSASRHYKRLQKVLLQVRR